MAVFGVSGSRNISVFSIRTFGHWDLRASVDLRYKVEFFSGLVILVIFYLSLLAFRDRRCEIWHLTECLFSLVIIMAGGRNGETVKG
ncbi:hypothetical protein FF1_035572 [Malus domestica]